MFNSPCWSYWWFAAKTTTFYKNWKYTGIDRRLAHWEDVWKVPTSEFPTGNHKEKLPANADASPCYLSPDRRMQWSRDYFMGEVLQPNVWRLFTVDRIWIRRRWPSAVCWRRLNVLTRDNAPPVQPVKCKYPPLGSLHHVRRHRTIKHSPNCSHIDTLVALNSFTRQGKYFVVVFVRGTGSAESCGDA